MVDLPSLGQAASIERAPTSPAVVDTSVALKADLAAGVKQQLEADARRIGGLRLLAGRFVVIRQAMGTPNSRGVSGVPDRFRRANESLGLRHRRAGAAPHRRRVGRAAAINAATTTELRPRWTCPRIN